MVDGADLEAGFLDLLDGSLLVLAQHIGHGDLLAAKESCGKGHHDADDGNGCHHGGDDLVLVGFGLFDLVGAGGARNRATGGILAAHARDGTHHGARLIGKLASLGGAQLTGGTDDARGLRDVDGTARQVAVEHLTQLVGGLEAVCRVLLHALEDDALKVGVDTGVDLARRNRQLVDLLECDRDSVVTVKGNAAGGALVHHDAQRVDIRGGAEVLTAGLLGADVVGGSQHVVVLREVAVLGARDAKVHHLDVAVGQHHDVLRLNVAVDDLVLVGDRKRGADLRADLGDLLGVEGAVALDAALKVGAAQVLHDDVIGVAVLAPIVDAHDIGGGETGCCLGLLLKACGEGCVASILRQHDLDGYRAVEDLVLRTEDGRHAACPHLILEEVSSPEDPLFHSCS